MGDEAFLVFCHSVDENTYGFVTFLDRVNNELEFSF